MKLVELSVASLFVDGVPRPVWVNIEHISTLEPDGSAVRIVLLGGTYTVMARESLDEIMGRIKIAEASG